MSECAWKVVKDGHAWDYSSLRVDCVKWMNKILREDPMAVVTIEPCSQHEMRKWKTS